MSYKLFVDDIRDYKNYYPDINMVVARSYHDAVDIINKNGIPDFISFDHDLADYKSNEEKTGYDLAKYIVQYMIDNNIKTKFDFVVHSSNPVGKKNIEMYIINFFKVYGM